MNSRPAEQPTCRTPFVGESCLTSTRVLAAYYFWYFAAIGVYEPYLTRFWQHLGYSPVQLGLLNAISPGIAVFAPFLWTAYADATRRGEAIFRINTWVSALVALVLPNLRSLSPMVLTVLVFAVFRTPLISIPARDPAALLLVQLTHAFTFGVFYLAAMQSMDMLVPEGLRATAQGVFASVVFGLSALVGSAVSGFLYEPLGMAWLYAAAAVLASAATVLYWVGTRQTVAAARVAAGRVSEGSSR